MRGGPKGPPFLMPATGEKLIGRCPVARAGRSQNSTRRSFRVLAAARSVRSRAAKVSALRPALAHQSQQKQNIGSQ